MPRVYQRAVLKMLLMSRAAAVCPDTPSLFSAALSLFTAQLMSSIFHGLSQYPARPEPEDSHHPSQLPRPAVYRSEAAAARFIENVYHI